MPEQTFKIGISEGERGRVEPSNAGMKPEQRGKPHLQR
jgi:hypothetical protein